METKKPEIIVRIKKWTSAWFRERFTFYPRKSPEFRIFTAENGGERVLDGSPRERNDNNDDDDDDDNTRGMSFCRYSAGARYFIIPI